MLLAVMYEVIDYCVWCWLCGLWLLAVVYVVIIDCIVHDIEVIYVWF